MSSCSRLQSRFFLCKAATLEHEASGRCILWGQCPAVIPVVDHKSGLTAINADVLAGDETSFVRCQKQRIESYRKELEAAQIKTLKQYGETVFMPSLAIRCSENTRTGYQGNLNKWIYPVLGDFKLPEVTAAQITALLLSMQAQNKSHSTVIKVYTVLQGLFKMAYLADNPMDKVQRPRPRKDEVKTQEAETYTAEEIRHIWNCLSQEPLKWRAMIRLLIDTGIRRGECCGLQWKDVDFARKYGVQGLHPHKLRHSFASIAITNGADIASVSEKLGHTDKAVTLRMYTHADQESIKRASQIFRDAIKEA